MATAYSYSRFSTPQQSDGHSLKRQSDAARKWSLDHKIPLDDSLTFEDLGKSAFHGKNFTDGELGLFIKAVDSGRIPKGSYLLVESLDRLSRQNVDEAHQTLREILKREINVVTLMDNKTFTKDSLSNFTDLLISLLVMQRAHEESTTKSLRLAAKWEQRRRNINNKKIATRYPSWLTLSDDYSTFTPIPEAVKVLKRIFAMYCAHKGVVTIAKTLNEGGTPCISTRSRIWKTTYIQQLLKSRALVGEYVMSRRLNGKKVPVSIPIKDYFPRIIDQCVFDNVQFLLGKVPKSPKEDNKYPLNIFAGKTYCPYCMEKMYIQSVVIAKKQADGTKKQYGTRRAFSCTASKNGKCINLSWDIRDFERQFLECSDEIAAAMNIRPDQTQEIRDAIGVITNNIKLKRRAIANISTIIESAEQVPDGAQRRWKELELELKDLEQQLSKRQGELASASVANPYAGVKTTLDGRDMVPQDRAKLRAVIASTIRRIYIFFAGSRAKYLEILADRERASKQHKREYVPDAVRTQFLRDFHQTRQLRFFVVHLNVAGKNNRIVYPRYEPSLESRQRSAVFNLDTSPET